MYCTVSAFVLVSSFLFWTHGTKILVVFPLESHSHYTLGFRLAKVLADRGHEVTFINAFPHKNHVKNLRQISVEMRGKVEDKKQELYEMGKMSYIGQLAWEADFGAFYTKEVLQANEIQELLHSNKRFDLVLLEQFMNEAMAIFQYKFKCPMVILSPGPPTVFNNHLFANPSQPAYVPNLLTDFGSDMTLWERILNLYYDVVGELHVQLVNIPKQNAILQELLPGAPDVRDILYNASFQLLLSHISLRDPSPLQPNIKEIGGYHVLPPSPLPKDLQEFLNNAEEGAIVFSMGSNLKSADFPQEKKECILRVFSRIRQKVLWKFEDHLPRKHNNVKTLSWLPQQDVMAHPNVKLFITHVGLLGKIEAVYHGVPFLGLPVYWDQRKNSYDATRQGFALTIPFPELTEKNFEWALNELLNNTKYRENAKMRSRIMHDQPINQMDEAMFWIEYVIRHKGAPHYRSPAFNLKWYQRLLLDIILVLGAAASVVFIIALCVLKIMFNSLDKNVNIKKRN